MNLNSALKILYGKTADTNQLAKQINDGDKQALLSIKKQYRKMAREHHPDKGGDAEKFKNIQGAYSHITSLNKENTSVESQPSEKRKNQLKKYETKIESIKTHRDNIRVYMKKGNYEAAIDTINTAQDEFSQLVALADSIDLAQDLVKRIPIAWFEQKKDDIHKTLKERYQSLRQYKKTVEGQIKSGDYQKAKNSITQAFEVINTLKSLPEKLGLNFKFVNKEAYFGRKKKEIEDILRSSSPTSVQTTPPAPPDLGKKKDPIKESSQNITKITNQLNSTPSLSLDDFSSLKKKLDAIQKKLKPIIAKRLLEIKHSKAIQGRTSSTPQEKSVETQIKDVQKKISDAKKAVLAANRKIENAIKRKAGQTTKAKAGEKTKEKAGETTKKTTKKRKKRTSPPKINTPQTQTTTIKQFTKNEDESQADNFTLLYEHITTAINKMPKKDSSKGIALTAARDYLEENKTKMKKKSGSFASIKSMGFNETIELINGLSKLKDDNVNDKNVNDKNVERLLRTWAAKGKSCLSFNDSASRRHFKKKAEVSLAEKESSLPEERSSNQTTRHRRNMSRSRLSLVIWITIILAVSIAYGLFYT